MVQSTTDHTEEKKRHYDVTVCRKTISTGYEPAQNDLIRNFVFQLMITYLSPPNWHFISRLQVTIK